MSCIALLNLRKADELHAFMPSLVVMWSQPSVDNEMDILEKLLVIMHSYRC